MATFKFENSAASNSGVFLLDIPDIDWFKDSVLSALAEMTIPENWYGDDEDYRQYALLQANRMMATYKVLNFNPFPIGTIIAYAVGVPPGYLLCDGSTYARTEYPELCAVIVDVWGYSCIEPDCFDVPNLMNYVIVGAGGDHAEADVGGHKEITLTEAQIPEHTHEDAGHDHSISLTTDGLAVAPGELPVVVPIPIITTTTGTGYAVPAYVGGGQPHSNMQPFVAINYCIYAGR